MNTNQPPYVPISCQFHDLLETIATTRKVVQTIFHDEEGVQRTCRSNIADVFSRQRAEFLRMGTGESIRLDRLVEVDGVRLTSFSNESAWCAASPEEAPRDTSACATRCAAKT